MNHFNIDPVIPTEIEVIDLENGLGKRELYESCNTFVRKQIEKEGVETLISDTLRLYPHGMSAGLFHVLIRLGYAYEGYLLEQQSTDEVSRALAYYITGYRKANVFHKKVPPEAVTHTMVELFYRDFVRNIVANHSTMGSRMKALYHESEYMEAGFLLSGSPEEKIRGLLNFLMSLFNKTRSIVVLHCITGLHALIMLKKRVSDFDQSLDILTTCIVTHLIASNIPPQIEQHTVQDLPAWDEIIEKGARSKDVHTIKLTYTCHELYKLYEIEGLKKVALNKIGNAH